MPMQGETTVKHLLMHPRTANTTHNGISFTPVKLLHTKNNSHHLLLLTWNHDFNPLGPNHWWDNMVPSELSLLDSCYSGRSSPHYPSRMITYNNNSQHYYYRHEINDFNPLGVQIIDEINIMQSELSLLDSISYYSGRSSPHAVAYSQLSAILL